MRPVADAYIAHLDGVDDREAAAALTLARGARRARVVCRRSGRASTSSRTSSAARSRTRTVGRWASCAGTLWNGAHDVATVDGADGRERMIPLVAGVRAERRRRPPVRCGCAGRTRTMSDDDDAG